jgi:hypothetical protein
MIRIEILSDVVDSFSGVSTKTGKPFTMRNQTGYAFLSDASGLASAYPAKIKIPLVDNQPPFPIGNYTILPQSIFVDKYDKLAIGSLSLKSVTVTSNKPSVSDIASKVANM